jgi:hypothetical protein
MAEVKLMVSLVLDVIFNSLAAKSSAFEIVFLIHQNLAFACIKGAMKMAIVGIHIVRNTKIIRSSAVCLRLRKVL